MARPKPDPVDSETVRELALSVMQADRFPMLPPMNCVMKHRSLEWCRFGSSVLPWQLMESQPLTK